MDYKPGDVVNGHVLGSDNQWHPVGPPTRTVTRLDPNQFGARYLRRWKWTVLVLTLLAMVPMLLGLGSYSQIDGAGAVVGGMTAGPLWLFGSLCCAVFFGSLINLIVAAFPSKLR